MPCLVTLVLLFTTSLTFAVADQVELKTRNRAGVPLHQEARGMHDFQRVVDGTQAKGLEVAPDNRWLKRSLPNGRTGWVTSREVSRASASAPSTGPAPSGKQPRHIEEAASSASPMAIRSP